MPVILKAEERSTGTVPDKTGVTETEAVALRNSFPETPDIVTGAVAAAADRSAFSVSTLCPCSGCWIKHSSHAVRKTFSRRFDAVTEAARGITLTLLVVVRPSESDMDGDAEMVKSGVPAL